MFKEMFKKWRKDKGLTQPQVAALLGVNLTTVKRWETGARTPDNFIGLAMAAIDHNLAPVGGLAMYRVAKTDRDDRKSDDKHDPAPIPDRMAEMEAVRSELGEALKNPVLLASQVAEFEIQIDRMENEGLEPSEISARITKFVSHFVAKADPHANLRGGILESEPRFDEKKSDGDIDDSPAPGRR